MPANLKELWKEPRPFAAGVVAKVFFERQFGEQKGDFVGSPSLEIVQSVDARLAHNWCVLGTRGDISSRKREARIVVKSVVEVFAVDVVAVSNDAREGNFAGDTRFERADTRGDWAGFWVFWRAAAGNE